MSVVALGVASTCAEILTPPFAISFPSSPLKVILPNSSPFETILLEEGLEDLDFTKSILGEELSLLNL